MRLGTLTGSMDEDALWTLHSCKCVLYVLDCTPDHIWWVYRGSFGNDIYARIKVIERKMYQNETSKLP